jgi:two-component system LytT family response regulator
MLKSIIVDDELKSRETLKKMITSFCQGIDVIATCQNVNEGIEAIHTLHPDVVFLDVQMQGETGFDLLTKLDEITFDVIFTTAHSEYALKAFKSSAIDYLLKPIDIGDLQKAVAKIEKKQETHFTERLQQLLQNIKGPGPENYKLALPISDGLIFIKAKEILYCKASGNYTEIFMLDGKKHLGQQAA